ncbi:MAG: DEAD/DEAH box helicase [Methanomicrobiales archaeon]|nr:DEAD/DEAH box helicase [Methanomicrobiales archaeon]
MKPTSFDELSLSPELRRAVQDLGFEEPTPIQALAIPAIREGNDVIGQAHTGTGKTAAYGLPLLERIDTGNRSIQALVICPTRELAIQVAEELTQLSRHKRGIVILPVYGGQSMDRQLQALRRGVQVVIATPGRLLDHLRRRTVTLDRARFVVLDEGDVMLDMGFIDDIEAILRQTPRDRQTLLFSATVPEEIRDLANRYLRNPKTIRVVHEHLTVPGIEQRYYPVGEQEKLEVLTRLLEEHDPKQSLIFCNTKRRTDTLARRLRARGFPSEKLHGDMTQGQRERVMGKFRRGEISVLVATDVAARGIDVEGIDAVFNYDVPNDPEYYVHRIGRTARAGRGGKSFTLVSPHEMPRLKDIQRYAGITIAQEALPGTGGKPPVTAPRTLPGATPEALPAGDARAPPAAPPQSTPVPLPVRETPAPRPGSTLEDRIRTLVQQGGLEFHRERVQELVAQGLDPVEIASALMALAGPVRSQEHTGGARGGKRRRRR